MKYECVALCRVMAQVSCELVAPKESRPNEGIMFFNIELSPMASPTFEQGRWERTLCLSVLLYQYIRQIICSVFPLLHFSSHQELLKGLVEGHVRAVLRLKCVPFSQTACAASVNHPWGFLALQAVWVVSEAKQTAGEMLEELQVHWYRVPVCGVWREGRTHTHTHTRKNRVPSCSMVMACVCVSALRCGRSEWTYTCWIMTGTWWMPPALLPSPLCATSGGLMSASRETKSQWWVSSKQHSRWCLLLHWICWEML